MKIVNPKVSSDIENDVPLKLDLGSGGKQREGFYSVDHVELEGVDILADLNEPLALLPDDCASYIHTRHALEHVENLLPLLREIWRVAKKDATIEITVPHFSNPLSFSDPTHVRFFGLYTMFYFVAEEDQPTRRKVPAFYSDTRFLVDSVRIDFFRLNLVDKLFAPIFSRLVNSNLACQEFYEQKLSGLFRAWQIRYTLRPGK